MKCHYTILVQVSFFPSYWIGLDFNMSNILRMQWSIQANALKLYFEHNKKNLHVITPLFGHCSPKEFVCFSNGLILWRWLRWPYMCVHIYLRWTYMCVHIYQCRTCMCLHIHQCGTYMSVCTYANSDHLQGSKSSSSLQCAKDPRKPMMCVYWSRVTWEWAWWRYAPLTERDGEWPLWRVRVASQ